MISHGHDAVVEGLDAPAKLMGGVPNAVFFRVCRIARQHKRSQPFNRRKLGFTFEVYRLLEHDHSAAVCGEM
jgi:hypothetical protein